MEINPDALRKARVAAGLSLAQVGGGELTRQAVHLIETGKVRPSMRSLRVLARRLQLPVATLLLPGSGGPPAPERSIAELDRLCRQREYEQALARGRQLLESNRSPELTASAHYFMGQALCHMIRPQDAMVHLEQARELFESLDDDQGRVAETLELEAFALQFAEDPRALTVAREALHRYRTVDGRRPEVESRLLQRLGTILAGRMEFDRAVACYEEALHVAGGVRDLVRLARIYHGMGMCHSGMGDVRLGAELFFKAHTLYEAEERLAGTANRSDMAVVENDIAVMLMRQGDLGRAEQHLQRSLARFEEAGLERQRSHLMLSYAELRQLQGRLDESVRYVLQAIQHAERFRETRALAVGYQQLGELHARRGERVLAVASFERALAILREAGLDRQHAACAAVRDRALSVRTIEGTAGA
ncbi:MAG TPA: helix-turn-helix transcriptional regulator [Candidatus Eisenbacteria bacterium]|nr:helix-turn-helix transcriptional regulator [Candidatus Eisenbacteria bacterium]